MYLALNTTSEKQYRWKKHLHAVPFRLECPPHDTSLGLCWDAVEPLTDGGSGGSEIISAGETVD